MQFSAALSLIASVSGVSAFVSQVEQRASVSALSSSRADLESLANDLNPIIGYYDPFKLADFDLYGESEEGVIGFLRHAEIKHGRVAMAAFVGFCVQSNVHFPWPMTFAGDSFPATSLAPEAQWDALPLAAKLQIIGFVGLLELYDESGGFGQKEHYMRGGQPGKYPTKEPFAERIHPIPFGLYDPFGLSAKRSDEAKKNGLIAEINNGRLAMLGIFGFLAADKIPGSVPVLDSIARGYDGEVMAPFTDDEVKGALGSAFLVAAVVSSLMGGKLASERNSGDVAEPAPAVVAEAVEEEVAVTEEAEE